jgi:hypothetical protein
MNLYFKTELPSIARLDSILAIRSVHSLPQTVMVHSGIVIRWMPYHFLSILCQYSVVRCHPQMHGRLRCGKKITFRQQQFLFEAVRRK